MEILNFLKYSLNLKNVQRQGWIDKLSIQNPESVADHSYSMAMMAMMPKAMPSTEPKMSPIGSMRNAGNSMFKPPIFSLLLQPSRPSFGPGRHASRVRGLPLLHAAPARRGYGLHRTRDLRERIQTYHRIRWS